MTAVWFVLESNCRNATALLLTLWFYWPAGVVMPSEEAVTLVFFMQIKHFVSGCQEVFAAQRVDPLDSKSK